MFVSYVSTETAPPWGSYCPSPWMQTWRSSRSSCSTTPGSRWVKLEFVMPKHLHAYVFKNTLCCTCRIKAGAGSSWFSIYLITLVLYSLFMPFGSVQVIIGVLKEQQKLLEPNILELILWKVFCIESEISSSNDDMRLWTWGTIIRVGPATLPMMLIAE